MRKLLGWRLRVAATMLSEETAMWLRIAVVGLMAAGMGIGVSAQQTTPSTGDAVADAARQARAAKQAGTTTPKKVYTDDDFHSTAKPAPTPATDAKPGDATAGDADKSKDQAAGKDANPENDPKSEVYWRKRFQKTREKLAQAERDLDVLQRESDKDQVQYYSDPQKAMQQQYSRSDINQKNAKIDAKKKEIEGLNQELSSMEDELRKVGGDPGWAR